MAESQDGILSVTGENFVKFCTKKELSGMLYSTIVFGTGKSHSGSLRKISVFSDNCLVKKAKRMRRNIETASKIGFNALNLPSCPEATTSNFEGLAGVGMPSSILPNIGQGWHLPLVDTDHSSGFAGIVVGSAMPQSLPAQISLTGFTAPLELSPAEVPQVMTLTGFSAAQSIAGFPSTLVRVQTERPPLAPFAVPAGIKP